MPMIGTTLARSGGGSPIPLRDTTSDAEPLSLVTASLSTMFGLDYGAAFLGSLSGNVFQDLNADNIRQVGENGLAGATVRVQQVVTEEGPTDEEGHGGQGGAGEGETTTPTVFLTHTAADGNWTITDLLPGTYTVTVIPPASYGISGGPTFSYTETVQSQSQITGIDFGNYPINDPPVIAAPPAQSGQEDTPIVFSTANGNALSVSDPDAGDLPVQLTIQATGGTLTLSQTTGLTFDTGTGTADGTIVVTGTLTDLNAALNGLTFLPTPHSSGAASVDVSVDDLGNSGIGGPQTTSTTIPLTVNAVADAPTLTVSNSSGNENEPVVLPITSALVDTDGSETLTITISGLPAGTVLSAGTNLGGGNWQLSPADLPALTLTSPIPGTYTLHVSATAQELNGSTASTEKTLALSLANLTPIVSGLSTVFTYQDTLTSLNLGRFDTPGTNSPWVVHVNWGDSTAESTFTVSTPGDLGTQVHTYTTGNTIFPVKVSVTDKYGHVGSNQFAVHVYGHAAIRNVMVNDGSPQRAQVNSLTVTFTGPVNLQPGAFELRNRLGQPVNDRLIHMNTTQYQVGNQTVAVLTFSGPRTIRGSLPTGRYQLAIHGDRIHDPSGQAVDANNNGTPGGIRTVPFFRLAGDLNGDGRFNILDWRIFRSMYRQSR